MKKLTILLVAIAIFTIVNTGRTNAEIYTVDLLSWWRLDNNDLTGLSLVDRGSLASSTTITSNATTTDRGGPVGQSFYFNGVNTYVDTSKNYTSLLSTGTTTVALWMRKDSTLSSAHTAFQMNYTEARNALRIEATNVIRVAYRYSGGTVATYTSGVTANNSKWNHVVVTFEGVNFNAYINGKLASTSQAIQFPTATSGATDKNAHIGVTYIKPNRTNYWIGNVDDVRIYDRALSAAEVAQVYNQGLVQHSLFNNF